MIPHNKVSDFFFASLNQRTTHLLFPIILCLRQEFSQNCEAVQISLQFDGFFWGTKTSKFDEFIRFSILKKTRLWTSHTFFYFLKIGHKVGIEVVYWGGTGTRLVIIMGCEVPCLWLGGRQRQQVLTLQKSHFSFFPVIENKIFEKPRRSWLKRFIHQLASLLSTRIIFWVLFGLVILLLNGFWPIER